MSGVSTVTLYSKPLPAEPASHMNTSFSPACSASNPTSCLLHGKAADGGSNPWAPVPMWQTQKVPGPAIRSVRFQQLQPFGK